MLFALIWSLICGSFIGWLAGKLMHHHTSLIRNIVVGIAGSALGNWLFSFLGFYAYGGFSSFLVSVVGACVLLWMVDVLSGRR
jgi:uncharacterized membrane protein YeaQ/YmgE (transglycosylase-associated protein family)